MEKISVIMPAYGVEKYIAKSIESVLNQTYKNLELIIVDDESPDNSGKIADEYAAKDDRVKVIHKKNGGVASARNAALDIASGDYITFIDSDDFADTHQYEVLYNLIKKYNVDISFCELQRFFDDEEPIKENVEIKESLIETSEALKQMLTNDCVGNYIHIKMFKSELWKNIRFPENCTYEDVATLYKVVGQASKVAYTTEKLYFYLVGRQGAITASFSERKLENSLAAYFGQAEYITKNFPEIKDYADYTIIRLYTSACEKMCLNNYDEMYNRADVLEKYEAFKNAMNRIDKSLLLENLEPYRLLSAVTLNYDREAFKKLLKEIHKVK